MRYILGIDRNTRCITIYFCDPALKKEFKEVMIWSYDGKYWIKSNGGRCLRTEQLTFLSGEDLIKINNFFGKVKRLHSLINALKDLFFSDLDIIFTLKDGKRELICVLKSNVWYDEKGSRHGGTKRRLLCYEGDDSLYEEIKDYTYREMNLEEAIKMIEELGTNYEIL